jgi:hypothetical protein
LPALDGDRRFCPRRSRRRWGFGRGRTGATWPIGATGHDGRWCARRATAEQGRRWEMATVVVARHHSLWGAGACGQIGRAWASRECGDAFPVPNLVRDGSEGGGRRWGGSGSYRRRWRRGVLRAGMPEGGGEVVEELLRDDVVPTGCSAGARRWRIGGSIGGRV